METTGAETRDRILDVAERLFAEMGYGNVSTRMLADEAHANSAAVHYHFGSKEKLLKALLALRLDPLNEERLAAIEAALRPAAGDRPTLDDLVRAFAEPLLRNPVTRHGQLSQAFIGRISLDPSPDVQRIMRLSYENVTKAFAEALAKACPDLIRQELLLRVTSIQSVVFSCCAENQAIDWGLGTADPSPDPGLMVNFILPMLLAMLQTPPVGRL